MVIIVIIHDGNGTSSLTVDRILVNGIHIPFRLVLPIMKVKEIWILIRITKENFQKENRWEGLGFPLRAKTVGVWSLRSGFVDVARKNLANCSPTRAADRCITDTAAIHGIRYTKKKKSRAFLGSYWPVPERVWECEWRRGCPPTTIPTTNTTPETSLIILQLFTFFYIVL